jgi:hypothetical protein
MCWSLDRWCCRWSWSSKSIASEPPTRYSARRPATPPVGSRSSGSPLVPARARGRVAFSVRLGPALDAPLSVGVEIACRVGVGEIAANGRDAEACLRLARFAVTSRAATDDGGGVA